jgi:hypothetical protein
MRYPQFAVTLTIEDDDQTDMTLYEVTIEQALKEWNKATGSQIPNIKVEFLTELKWLPRDPR